MAESLVVDGEEFGLDLGGPAEAFLAAFEVLLELLVGRGLGVVGFGLEVSVGHGDVEDGEDLVS